MDDLVLPFMFVPDGAAPDHEWLARYPGWVKFPATLVWRYRREDADLSASASQAGAEYWLTDGQEDHADFRNAEFGVKAAITTTGSAAQGRAALPAAASSLSLAFRPSVTEAGYTTNPDQAARALGIDRHGVGDAIYRLKHDFSIRGDENLRIEIPSGDVFFNGENIGNLFDER